MEMGAFGISVRFVLSSSYLSVSIELTQTFSSIVAFRMVVFRPFVSEVMLAKVKSSDEDGIRRKLISLWRYLVHQNLSSPHSFG